MPSTNTFSSLSPGAVCMYVHTTLTVTSCLHRASRSARGEGVGSSRVSPGHANSPPHAGDLGIPRNVSELLWASHSLFFLLRFFFWSSFCYPHLGSYDTKQLPVMLCNRDFSAYPQGELWVRSNKDKPWEQSCSESYQTTHQRGWGSCGASDLFFSLQRLRGHCVSQLL